MDTKLVADIKRRTARGLAVALAKGTNFRNIVVQRNGDLLDARGEVRSQAEDSPDTWYPVHVTLKVTEKEAALTCAEGGAYPENAPTLRKDVVVTKQAVALACRVSSFFAGEAARCVGNPGWARKVWHKTP